MRETTYLARSQSGATLLYLDDGYLYFSKAGTNGNALWRIRYDGSKSDYVSFGNASDTPSEYKPIQYLQIDYNDSWFAPEVVGGYLFFSNAEEYAENYVYAYAALDCHQRRIEGDERPVRGSAGPCSPTSSAKFAGRLEGDPVLLLHRRRRSVFGVC